MDSAISIAIVTDDAALFILVQRAIVGAVPGSTLRHYPDGEAFLEDLTAHVPEIVVADYRLEGMTGLRLLEALQMRQIALPVVMLAAPGEEDLVASAMNPGAWAYIVRSKDFLTLLPGVIGQVLRERALKRSLRESEEKYRLVVENAVEAIIVAQDGRLRYVNPRGIALMGFPAEELLSRPFGDFIHPADRDLVMDRHLRRQRGEDPPRNYLFRIADGQGAWRWLEISAVRIDWEGQAATLNFLNDVTERMRVLGALRESEARFRSIFEESPIGISLYDANGWLLDTNRAGIEILEAGDLDALKRQNLFEQPAFPVPALRSLLPGDARRFETVIARAMAADAGGMLAEHDGKGQMDVTVRRIGAAEEGAFDGYLVQFLDISTRKQAEAYVQSLSQQLMKVHEAERQKLACDLHDHLAQDLSSLKISLDTLCDEQPDFPEEKRRCIANLSRLVRQAITEVRDMAYNLRPACLDQLGLVQTLQQHCEDYSQRHAVAIDFFSAGLEEVRLGSDTEIGIYRLVQESLNNIRKHAAASQVTVKLVASYPNLILRIEDNGKGFDPQTRLTCALRERRMGLWSMEQRTALLGGRIRIDAFPLLGTKILVEVPLKEKGHGAKTGTDCR